MLDIGCGLRKAARFVFVAFMMVGAVLEWFCELPFRMIVELDNSYTEVWAGLEDPAEIVEDYRRTRDEED